MNRRDLIRRGPLALLGVVGIAIGAKGGAKPDTPTAIHVVTENNVSHIINVVAKDYARGGRLRELVRNDGASSAQLYDCALSEAEIQALYAER